jgi:uncharacterized protein (TIGR03118 family)
MSVRAVPVSSSAARILVLPLIVLLGALQLIQSPVVRADEDGGFVQTNLVSDLPNMAPVQDPNLKNPWGIVHGPTTPWWVSDNNGNVSTLYDGAGTPFPPPPAGPLVVNIPAPTTPTGGTPTGIVYNAKPADFVVSDGQNSGSSLFIFATEDGTIAGWSPGVSRTQAFIAVDNSQVPSPTNGAVYKGLALAQTEDGQRLYAANFRAGTVDVFNSKFKPVQDDEAFRDRHIPSGYAPFGIQEIGGRIYVTYAQQNADRHDDVSGPGHGFVDVFNTEGRLLKRLIRHGALNSPWGMALAPENFGDHSGQLLVGNFGNGRINAYDARSGEFEGALRRPNGTPVQIEGLWGLSFGNGKTAGPLDSLFFAAGINGEQNGLFGSLRAAGEENEH